MGSHGTAVQTLGTPHDGAHLTERGSPQAVAMSNTTGAMCAVMAQPRNHVGSWSCRSYFKQQSPS